MACRRQSRPVPPDLARPEVSPAHARAGVDQYGDSPAARIAQVGQRLLPQEWPHESQGQQDERRGAQEKQEPLVQTAAPREPRRRGRQKHERAEWHLAHAASGGSGETQSARRRPGNPERTEASGSSSGASSGRMSSPRQPLLPHPGLQEIEEDQLQRPVGYRLRVLDAQISTRALDGLGVSGEPAEVFAAPCPGRYTPHGLIPGRGTSLAW